MTDVLTLEQAKATIDRLGAEKHDLDKRTREAQTALRDAWCAHHGVQCGSDIMLKRWQTNYKTPAGPRKARITTLSVSYYGNIHMTATPYTAAGRPGTRAHSVSDGEWEKIA